MEVESLQRQTDADVNRNLYRMRVGEYLSGRVGTIDR